jgi:hypothetical protein
MSITRVGRNVVVKTIYARFLLKKANYVVAKTTSVTDGYGQGSATSKKLTALKAAYLLGSSAA